MGYLLLLVLDGTAAVGIAIGIAISPMIQGAALPSHLFLFGQGQS